MSKKFKKEHRRNVKDLHMMLQFLSENPDIEIMTRVYADEKPTTYMASSTGIIYSVGRSGNYTPINTTIDKDTGRSIVNLKIDGSVKKVAVDIIIAMAFVPQEDEHHRYIKHKDGRRRNNSALNLEWCNEGDYLLYKSNVVDQGIQEEDIETACEEFEKNEKTVEEISEKTKISPYTLRDILRRGLYSDVSRKFNIKNYMLDEDKLDKPIVFEGYDTRHPLMRMIL